MNRTSLAPSKMNSTMSRKLPDILSPAGASARKWPGYVDDESESPEKRITQMEFGKPITVDNGKPIGRVDVLMLSGNSALVSWMENTANGVEIQVRKMYSNGNKDESVTVSKSKGDRASGFPRMVQTGNKVIIGWTETRDARTVKTAVININ